MGKKNGFKVKNKWSGGQNNLVGWVKENGPGTGIKWSGTEENA